MFCFCLEKSEAASWRRGSLTGTLMGDLRGWQTLDIGGELWRRHFRPRLLRPNCGVCRLFGDINPKVGPGQVSDLEQQKLSEVQSQHGVQWLVTHYESQKDLQRPDNAVFGKQRDMGEEKMVYWGTGRENQFKRVSNQQGFSFTRSIPWPACKVPQ